MRHFMIRAAVLALSVLPGLALGDAGLPGPAPETNQAETVAEAPPVDETLTLLLADPVEPPTDADPATEPMPEQFYLGDNCDYVAPVPTV